MERPPSGGLFIRRNGSLRRGARVAGVHLRPPSIDHGVQSFLWALVFFLYLWFGMRAVGVSSATAFVLALVLGALIFLFVRIFGEEDLARPHARRPRRR